MLRTRGERGYFTGVDTVTGEAQGPISGHTAQRSCPQLLAPRTSLSTYPAAPLITVALAVQS